VADKAAEIRAEEGTCYPQEHRDEDATRILAGHDKFRESANNEANDCNPDEVKHVFLQLKDTGAAGGASPLERFMVLWEGGLLDLAVFLLSTTALFAVLRQGLLLIPCRWNGVLRCLD